ncbi:MAG: hypothetical protein Q9160_006907 [Pyrenula sp. 1 TL-2023]
MKLSPAILLLYAALGALARGLDDQINTHAQLVFSGKQILSNAKELSKVINDSPLLSFHRDLVRLPSVTFDEEAVGNFLEQYLASHNFTVQKQKVPQPGGSVSKPRYNIIARPDPYVYGEFTPAEQIPGPQVLLSSHIDTVPPFLPYDLSIPSHATLATGQRELIRISGRGTVDDKACVAAQTHALLSLLATKKIPATAAALVFVVGEEGPGDGMSAFSSSDINEALANSYRTVIFGEPTEGKLASGHKGITMVSIDVEGKAAHSGYPWLGRSAISVLIPILAKLDTLGSIPESEGGLPRSEKYGNTTVNIGRIEGGVAANVVAERASATIAIRIAAGSPRDVRRIVSQAISDAAPEITGLKVVIREGYGPIDIDHDIDGFETITVNYGTDIPWLKVEDGVKRYLYGPGSILVAHGANEGLTVGNIEKAVDDYQKLILASLDR